MIFIFIFILLNLFFCLSDYFFWKEQRIGEKVGIRLSISLIIGSIIFYIMNLSTISKSVLEEGILLFTILLLIQCILSLVFRKNRREDNKILGLEKILVIILSLECFVFSYQHFLTLNNKLKEVKNYKIEEKIIGKEKQKGIQIPVKGIDLNSIYLDVENKQDKLTRWRVYALDKESKTYQLLNLTEHYQNIKKSYYKTIYNTYDSDFLFLGLYKNNTFQVNKIILNPIIPIQISVVRILLLFTIVSFFHLFRPSISLYKEKVKDHSRKINKILIVFFIGISMFTLILTNLNPVFRKGTCFGLNFDGGVSVDEYPLLAESLSKGKIYLEKEPTKELKTINNPYNTKARQQKLKNSKKEYLWDVAYYNGKYYVYFGVVPVLLTYLPFYIVTGHHLSSNFVVWIALTIITAGFLLLMKHIAQKYTKNTSIGSLCLILLFFLLGNHFILLYVAKRPDFYSIPILFGIMFSLLGINCWLRSIKKDHSLNKEYLFLGSLSMALVAGCRPQLLLISFCSIIIFKDYIKEKRIFSKEGRKELLSFMIPYIIIAILCMWYNYARFGSVFDFGANYNLTTNDMTKRGFHLERIGLGLYYFLFSVPRFSSIFPFIETLPLHTNYIGITIYENMYGGILAMSPLLIIGLLFFKFKNFFIDKKLYNLTMLFSISSIIILILDTNMAGILPRYTLDFEWLLALSTGIILLNIFETWKNKKENTKVLNKILYTIVVIALIYNFFLLFTDISYTLKSTMPALFYKIYYMIQFWL